MSDNKKEMGWWGAFVNLFRPEPDMVSLEEEVVQLRAEIAQKEREAAGKVAVYEDDLVAIADGIRMIQQKCTELEGRLERIGRPQTIGTADEGGAVLGTEEEENGW